MFEGFSQNTIDTDEARIYLRVGGTGPPLLLLHGFPQTHLMWRDIAPSLARDFTVVCPDLRGYGKSSCPASSADHAPYSKRAMGADMVRIMAHLGFEKFAIAGHDRGGRVAYRLAIDAPANVTRVAVLDVLPTEIAWTLADARFVIGYWPWSLLAQPTPLPERMLVDASAEVVDNALKNWGPQLRSTPVAVREAYVSVLKDPAHAHAICEEYRAAASIDREHDQADVASGRKIAAPLLALWSSNGPLDTWYAAQSGPLSLWRQYAVDVQGHAIEGGHFFPEQNPEATLSALQSFLPE
jgi:haloacetate dehalogenase